jgi:hypothetical protein
MKYAYNDEEKSTILSDLEKKKTDKLQWTNRYQC